MRRFDHIESPGVLVSEHQMKKPSFRPLLTAMAAACMLPAAGLHAQTTLQSPGGQLGESAAQPAGTAHGHPHGRVHGGARCRRGIDLAAVPAGDRRLHRRRARGLQLPRAIAGVEHDSNVHACSTGKITDTITQLGLGLRFNKRYGLQRVRAGRRVRPLRLRQAVDQTTTTLNYAAAWYWSRSATSSTAWPAPTAASSATSPSNGGDRHHQPPHRAQRAGRGPLQARRRLARARPALQHTDAQSTDPTVSWDGDPT